MLHIETLKSLLTAPDAVLHENIDEKYQSDHLGRLKGRGEAVVFPSTTQEVSAVLAYANREKIPVTPRGAGTNLVGSTIPDRGGIVLDLSRMNKILEVDGQTMTATVEAGLHLDEFQTYVEEQGFFYPPDPGEKKSSLGGNISTNAGGMRAVKYGVTRDYVRGLEVVKADGSILTLGGKQVKDASGLSLKESVIGAEGTLCVITKCLLKLLPKPDTSASVLVPYGDFAQGISSVLTLLQSSTQPTAVEFMQRVVVEYGEDFLGQKYPCPEANCYLLLTFDGCAEEVQRNLTTAEPLLRKQGALDFVILEDPALKEFVWTMRGSLVKAVEAVSPQIPLDMVVPVDKIADFMGYIAELSEKTQIKMIGFGHAGDGNVHLCVLEENHSPERLKEVMMEAYHKTYALGGVTSGEHGIGLSKQPYFHKETDPAVLDLMTAVKYAFDPVGILNQGKSYMREGDAR